MELNIPLKLIISFVIGAVIGTEREVSHRRIDPNSNDPTPIIGLRTFSLASTLGSLVGILYKDYLFLSIILASAFFSLALIFYIRDSASTKDTGITTELSLFYSFLIGLLISLEVIPIQLTLAISVILIFLLSIKKAIKQVMDEIQKRELNAFIRYAIIALVILPFLPNISYSLSNIPNLSNVLKNFGINFDQISKISLINPFKLWTIVALITGVDLIGYVLEKTIGQKKGWLLASAAGGFISSTATTLSLAQQSKQSRNINHLVSAALIANLVSFIQIGIVIGAINILFLANLIPALFAMIFTSAVIAIFFLKSKEPDTNVSEQNVGQKEIINLSGALKFALIFIVVSVVSKIALTLFGETGFLVTSGIGSIIGLDAVMINTAQSVNTTISLKLATISFLIANLINLTTKSFYSFLQGDKKFAIKFSISVLIITLSSLVALL